MATVGTQDKVGPDSRDTWTDFRLGCAVGSDGLFATRAAYAISDPITDAVSQPDFEPFSDSRPSTNRWSRPDGTADTAANGGTDLRSYSIPYPATHAHSTTYPYLHATRAPSSLSPVSEGNHFCRLAVRGLQHASGRNVV